LLDSLPDAWMFGTQPNDYDGTVVGGVGDVNGDGRSEVAIGNISTRNRPERVWVCKYTGPGISEAALRPVSRWGLHVAPNPTRGQVELTVEGCDVSPAPGVTAAIYDCAGKRLATLAVEPAGNGVARARWTCRDWQGNRLPCGTYWVRVSSGKGGETVEESVKLVLMP
jgi:hypothetical protein